MTQNQSVLEYLKSKKRNVAWHKSLGGFWSYLRAGFVIGTGIKHPNFFRAIGKKTVKICLYHGMGPRSTNAGRDPEAPKYDQNGEYVCRPFDLIKLIHKWDYFNFTSRFTETIVGKLQFLLPSNKRIVMGYPRCDHLLNSFACEKLLLEKPSLKNFFCDVNTETKIILYSPTWRFSNLKVSLPILNLPEFNLKKFDSFLEKTKAYFLISAHPLVKEFEDLKSLKHIRYLPQDNTCDINSLLPEISVLVTDYSSIMTDFALLDRPLLFVMPDYNDFLYERGLLEDFRSSLPGREALNFDDLVDWISRFLNQPSIDSDRRKKYLEKYYDMSLAQSCERLKQFMVKLL